MPLSKLSSPAMKWFAGKCILKKGLPLHYSKAHRPILVRYYASTNKNDRQPEFKDPLAPTDIYKGPLTDQLRGVKLFSLMTSAMGIPLQPKIVMDTLHGEIPLAASIAALALVSLFTYVTPFCIHYLAKRYVTKITFNPEPDSYTATTYTFFLQPKQHTYKVEDVFVPDVPGIFTTFLVKTSDGRKNVPLFLSETAFSEPLHYGIMMGYDKPINFHLYTESEKVQEPTESKETKSKDKVKIN